MRERLPPVWRNLLLLYLSLFLVMSAWGATNSVLARWAWPAAAIDIPERPIPSLPEMLGLWPPGRQRWHRLLELTIPGLTGMRPKKLTLLPSRPSGSA